MSRKISIGNKQNSNIIEYKYNDLTKRNVLFHSNIEQLGNEKLIIQQKLLNEDQNLNEKSALKSDNITRNDINGLRLKTIQLDKLLTKNPLG